MSEAKMRYIVARPDQSFDPAIIDNQTGLIACFETLDGLSLIAHRMNLSGPEQWAWEIMPSARRVAAARNAAAAEKRREAKAAKRKLKGEEK